MRWSAAVLALLLLVPSPLLAQEPAALLEDPAGDVDVSSEGTEIPANPWSTLDLRALEWSEGPDSFDITLTVEDLEAPREQVIIVDGIDYYIRFQYGHQYQVNLWRSPLGEEVWYGGALRQLDPATGRYAHLETLDVLVDEAAGTLSTTFPKAPIQDADGKTPGLGDTLQEIHVVSHALGATAVSSLAGPVSFQATDRMPDQASAAWDIVYGIEQSGHIRLESARPTRASNGEATTLIYEVTAQNLGQTQDTIRLTHGTLPQNWVVTFPQERVRLDAEASVEIPVLITVPFAHSHGNYESTLVEAQSQRDPNGIGRIELGVRYTAVPQPSGHHDTLWIHNGGGLYINAQEDHAGDSGEPSPSRSESQSTAQTRSSYRWDVPLLPALQMGLDFDTEREGEIAVTVEMPAGGIETHVAGRLILQRGAIDFFGEGDDTLLATFTSAPADVMPGEVRTFTANVSATSESDRVEWEADTNLVLVIEVTTTSVFGTSLTPASPSIHPGTSLRLPLDEYHDEVSGYFSTLSGIDMWAADGQERLVNPGETALFAVEAENLGDEAATFDLRLSGTNAAWAEILSGRQVTLEGGQSSRIHVAASVPEDVADGERADVTLHAEHADDPNVRSLVRFLIEADRDEDHPDDAEAAASLREGPARDSPSPWVFCLAVLAATALIRRRLL